MTPTSSRTGGTRSTAPPCSTLAMPSAASGSRVSTTRPRSATFPPTEFLHRLGSGGQGMGIEIGMDVEAVGQIAQQLHQRSAQLRGLAQDIDSMVRRLNGAWQG